MPRRLLAPWAAEKFPAAISCPPTRPSPCRPRCSLRIGRKPETIAAGLTVPERVLLFCVASGRDWRKAGVTGDVCIGSDS